MLLSIPQQIIATRMKYFAIQVRNIAVLLSCCLLLSAQGRPVHFDGPYISRQADSLHIQWVERGFPYDTLIAQTEATVFQRDSLPAVNLKQLNFPTDKASTYSEVERIVAISDVHGQYHLMRQLLLASGVIDTANNWTLGKGHLVVIGDNFDRGDEVLPILWLLFELEQQALAQGGRLHLLLGNHELMVLQADLRYLHKKYYYTAGALQTPYHLLFAQGSILGDWIAQHQVVVSINQHLFVHAGISPEVLALGLSLDELNTLYQKRILRQPEADINADPTLALLYGNLGPLWYRGYFGEEAIAQNKLNRQLKRLDQQKIIVGHTSQDDIHPRYNGKLIVIDCSIKLGQRGQVLLIENGQPVIIDQDGEYLPITTINPKPTTSIQDLLMASSTRPQLTIHTDFPRLLRKKYEEEYLPAEISLQASNLNQTFYGRARARGNIRKKVCYFPPIMLDLRKSALDSLGFLRHDKIKLVIPCHIQDYQQVSLYKEYLLYDLYRLIDEHGIKTQLVDVEVIGPKKTHQLTGFFIETERDYAHRTGAEVLHTGRINASALDRSSFVHMQLFQYMIANCDWSLRNKHNLEIAKYENMDRPKAIAYDFDYAGFVGNKYATPHPDLPIKSVHERYFFSYKTTDEELDQTIAHFLELEEELYAACAAASYLNDKAISQCQAYLRTFFDLLRQPEKFKREIGRS